MKMIDIKSRNEYLQQELNQKLLVPFHLLTCPSFQFLPSICRQTPENLNLKIEVLENSSLTKTSEYFFDALGRRIRKKITNHTDSSKSYSRKFIYDGQEILAELDEDNTTLAVFTHSTLRIDDVLAVDVKDTKLAPQTGSYFYLKDALGSIIDIVDSSGNLKQHYAYSSFGKIVKISDASELDVTENPIIKTSYGFTNREYDEESGLMYYRARFYMPEIGRFMQEDPHPGRLEFPRTHDSKYIYTLNNPLKYRDPFGEFVDPITLAVVGAIIGGINGILKNQRDGGNWFEDVIGGAIIGGTIGFALGTLGALGVAGNIAAWTVSVKSILQAAFTRKGGFIDNLGTFSSRNLASSIPLTFSSNKLKTKFGFKDNGLGLFDFAGWLFDFENVYDTACEGNGTQKDQQVCEQRPELVYIEI
jgi:RHS repeat-associated protein